jgi:flagellar biosynthesis protein FliQ
MTRTFTLRRLMLNVTGVCVTCGLVSAFPSAAGQVAAVLLTFVPALIVAIAMSWLSSRPWRALLVALGGATVCYLLAPVPSGTSLMHDYWLVFEQVAPWTMGGALVCGAVCAAWWPRLVRSRRE